MPAVDSNLTRYSFGFFKTNQTTLSLKSALEQAFQNAQIDSAGAEINVAVIGCNTGYEFPPLEEIIKKHTGKQAHLLGLDIVIRYIQQAKKTYGNKKNYFFRAVDAAQPDEVKTAIKDTLGVEKVDVVVLTHPYLSTTWPFSYSTHGQDLLNKFSDMLTQVVPKILQKRGTLLGIFIEDERLNFNEVIKSTFLQEPEPCNKLFTRNWAMVRNDELPPPYGQFTIVTQAHLNSNAKKYFLTPEKVSLPKILKIMMYNLVMNNMVNPIADIGLDMGVSRFSIGISLIVSYYLCLLLGVSTLSALLFYTLRQHFNQNSNLYNHVPPSPIPLPAPN